MPNPLDNLRPQALKAFVGQDKLKNVLSIAIAGAQARKEPLRHTLFDGPPGLGKTTLANILATETQRELIVASATSVSKVAALATLLNQLSEKRSVLFIDEIHRLPRVVEEALYTVMEDFRLDVTSGKLHLNMRLPHFTLVGATTRPSLLTRPLLDRFASHYHLSFYSEEELAQIVQSSALKAQIVIAPEAALTIAQRSKKTPRIANNLLLQARDFALSFQIGQISQAVVVGMFEATGIDSKGLTDQDRQMLQVIIERFDGGPVGLATLASILGEEPDVLERLYEPYLLQEHFIERTPKGRVVTALGYQHLGLTPKAPRSNAQIVDDYSNVH